MALAIWADGEGMSQIQNERGLSRAYQNGVLTVIAVALGLMVLDQTKSNPNLAPASAVAAVQPADKDGDAAGIMSGLEQRKQMIAELQRIGSKLDKIESKLNGGLVVKIANMPAENNGRTGAVAEPKPGSKIEVKPDASKTDKR